MHGHAHRVNGGPARVRAHREVRPERWEDSSWDDHGGNCAG